MGAAEGHHHPPIHGSMGTRTSGLVHLYRRKTDMMARKGLAKLVEEAGEVLQVVGKIEQVGDVDAFHWSGELRQMLEEEIGDLYAALSFVRTKLDLDALRIWERRCKKLDLFEQWDKE
jgi:NTP pyrophosphatase (non-canonical NTP hydrolase)